MMESTSKNLVPLVLGAMALGCFFLSGCGRTGEEELKADPPSVYMKDPVFRKALDDAQAELEKLLKLHARFSGEMKEMVDAAKAAAPKSADAEILAKLKENPLWLDIRKKLSDVNEAIADRRKRTADIVRRRLSPRKVSK